MKPSNVSSPSTLGTVVATCSIAASSECCTRPGFLIVVSALDTVVIRLPSSSIRFDLLTTVTSSSHPGRLDSIIQTPEGPIKTKIKEGRMECSQVELGPIEDYRWAVFQVERAICPTALVR